LVVVDPVPIVAGKTVSRLSVPGLAEITDWLADQVLIEESSIGTGQTDGLIPGCAKRVRLWKVGESGIDHTAACLKHKSSVALVASSIILVPDPTVGVHFLADSLCIGEESQGTLYADSVLESPAPSVLDIVQVHELALPIVQDIALIASLAGPDRNIELLAELLNLAAHSVLIEEKVVRALGAYSLGSGPAPEIVVYDPQEIRVLELRTVPHLGLGDLL
jgi:hypothetical protein